MPETEGPPKNAGEVSCPRPGLGTQHPQTPPPLEDERQRRESCRVPTLGCAGFTPECFSWWILYLLFLSLCDFMTVSWSLPWSLTSCMISASSSLPPLVSPLLFLSSVHISLRGIDYKQSCGLACGQELIQWFPKRNDIIVRFVVQIVEWQ